MRVERFTLLSACDLGTERAQCKQAPRSFDDYGNKYTPNLQHVNPGKPGTGLFHEKRKLLYYTVIIPSILPFYFLSFKLHHTQGM